MAIRTPGAIFAKWKRSVKGPPEGIGLKGISSGRNILSKGPKIRSDNVMTAPRAKIRSE